MTAETCYRSLENHGTGTQEMRVINSLVDNGRRRRVRVRDDGLAISVETAREKGERQ